jgi:3-dehydroquinate synthetase
MRLPVLGEQAFAGLLLHDKKAAGPTMRFILLRRLGEACIREQTSPSELWPLFGRFLEEMPGVLRHGDA